MLRPSVQNVSLYRFPFQCDWPFWPETYPINRSSCQREEKVLFPQQHHGQHPLKVQACRGNSAMLERPLVPGQRRPKRNLITHTCARMIINLHHHLPHTHLVPFKCLLAARNWNLLQARAPHHTPSFIFALITCLAVEEWDLGWDRTCTRKVDALALLLEPQKIEERMRPPRESALDSPPCSRPQVRRGTASVTDTAQCSSRSVPAHHVQQHAQQNMMLPYQGASTPPLLCEPSEKRFVLLCDIRLVMLLYTTAEVTDF